MYMHSFYLSASFACDESNYIELRKLPFRVKIDKSFARSMGSSSRSNLQLELICKILSRNAPTHVVMHGTLVLLHALTLHG
jgi:EAL domain-containing protein (putative c-di-GMP-specific phosphodiesterase class I)